MNKRIIPALMSGLLILGSCFSPIVAGQADRENTEVNWREVTDQIIETPLAIGGYGAFGFGTAFIPTGTFVFGMAMMLTLVGRQETKINAKTDTEKSVHELQTLLVVGAGVAGHVAGWYCLIKLAQVALEAIK